MLSAAGNDMKLLCAADAFVFVKELDRSNRAVFAISSRDDDDDAVITDACEPYGFQHAVTTRSRLLLRQRDAAFLSGLLHRLW
ncbi:hypothetical protein MY4824_005091 [Beauveria thailandica]